VLIALDGLLLDLDDTLFDHRSAANLAAAQFARTIPGWHGTDREAADRWLQLENEHFPKYARGECSLREQHRLRVRDFHRSLAEISDAAADAIFRSYLTFYETHWRPLPGSASLIARALAAGLKVGVLTNGDEHQQRLKLERIGLLHRQLLVFTSAELGVAKPSARAYELACAGLHTAPERTLMVGDNHENDVAAARAAGLQAIHFDRAGAGLDPLAHATLAEIEFRIFGGA
jgi:putative hydrolase of the HAD superfamily